MAHVAKSLWRFTQTISKALPRLPFPLAGNERVGIPSDLPKSRQPLEAKQSPANFDWARSKDMPGCPIACGFCSAIKSLASLNRRMDRHGGPHSDFSLRDVPTSRDLLATRRNQCATAYAIPISLTITGGILGETLEHRLQQSRARIRISSPRPPLGQQCRKLGRI